MNTLQTLSHILIAPPLWLALLFAVVFAALSWQAHWLSRSGALATAIIGFVVLGFGGGLFLIPLLAFFLSSSLLSRLGRARKALAKARTAKGSVRDAGQVWANGGVAFALVLLYAYVVRRWPVYETRLVLMVYLAALATVNADTWATEIGALSRKAPRSLLDWRMVPAGTSGAVSGLGVLAAGLGAILIPLVALPFWHLVRVEFVAVAWAGFLGSLLDSVLGAGVQAQYHDPATGELTDRPQTEQGKEKRARGLPWINNDMVNFLASVGGALCAWVLLRFSGYMFL